MQPALVQYRLLLWMLMAIFLVVAALTPYVEAKPRPFTILSIHTERLEDIYLIDAQINFTLTDPVREALLNGVALIFTIEIEISRPSGPWGLLPDDIVARLEQRYKLSYHALSRQFIVENQNAGIQDTFPDLASALNHMGDINNLPLIDASLLVADQRYLVKLRAGISRTELPLLLQARAFTSDAWRLSTDWHTWPLQ